MTVSLKPNKYSPLVLAAVLAKYGKDKTIDFKFKTANHGQDTRINNISNVIGHTFLYVLNTPTCKGNNTACKVNQ